MTTRRDRLPKRPAVLLVAAMLVASCRGHAGPSSAALPADHRSCTADADCAVAPSLAGLAHLPRAGDTCRGTCFVGVRKDALEAWQKAVDALAATVPCDKEFEPCPPASDFRARCLHGTCEADYAPATR